MKTKETAALKSLLVVLSVTTLMVNPDLARADFVLGQPQNLGSIFNTTRNEAGITLSSDGLELYFSSQRAGGHGDYDIWVSTRPSVDEAWGPAANLGEPVNSPYTELYPCISSDGLMLYFSDYYSGSPRPGGRGGGDIWMTTRASRDDAWTMPVNLGAPINTANLDMSPTVSADGLTLVLTSRDRAGGHGSWDLWISTRLSVDDPWGTPLNLGPAVNSSNWEGESGLSADGRALVFGSGRPGLVGGIDLWITTRKRLDDPWAVAVNAGPVVNSARDDGTARFSPDMRTLYFCSDRADSFGGYDLYEAAIEPVVDFDGNEIVDIADLLRLIESWDQDDPAVDIGPAPWGDGIVDGKDVEVLMSYWGREITSPFLIAHWKLDEQDGVVANDSAGANDGTVIGTPMWQPAGGVVDGALELDGNTYVLTDRVVNPAEGAFSVFGWVKGGMPEQVLMSQVQGQNWLMADATTGALATNLIPPVGRSPIPPLVCDTVITDGSWHRVGFVWNGTSRALYVDDILVAEDLQNAPASCTGDMNIGCDKDATAGTFWTGMIDDVRIYNRIVTP